MVPTVLVYWGTILNGDTVEYTLLPLLDMKGPYEVNYYYTMGPFQCISHFLEVPHSNLFFFY